jgi:hypothetical protein
MVPPSATATAENGWPRFRRTEARGTEARETEARETEAQGTEAQGTEAQGTFSKTVSMAESEWKCFVNLQILDHFGSM